MIFRNVSGLVPLRRPRLTTDGLDFYGSSSDDLIPGRLIGYDTGFGFSSDDRDLLLFFAGLVFWSFFGIASIRFPFFKRGWLDLVDL